MAQEQGMVLQSAAAKFWGNPDVVEKLLGFLDAGSIACLVQIHLGSTLQVLQGDSDQSSSVW